MVRITGELKERVIQALADPESRRIIDSVYAHAKTISTIEEEVRLPQSTLYRKVSELRNTGLLMVDRFVIRPDGKRDALYLRSFDEVRFISDDSGIRVEVIQSAKSLEKRWFELFFSNVDFSALEPPGAASGSFG